MAAYRLGLLFQLLLSVVMPAVLLPTNSTQQLATNSTTPVLCQPSYCVLGDCEDDAVLGAVCSCSDNRLYLDVDGRTCRGKLCTHTDPLLTYTCGAGALCSHVYDLLLQVPVPQCSCKQAKDKYIKYVLNVTSRACHRDKRYETCDWPVNAGCEQLCSVKNVARGVGTYPQCSCEQGYQLDSNGKTCSVSDPCLVARQNGGCEQICTFDKTTLHVSCGCREDFSLRVDNKTCLVRNCDNGNSRCEQNCVEVSDNDFYCTCAKGFHLNPDLRTCYDYDECSGFHGCDQLCVRDGHGYYKCACSFGFFLSDDGFSCKHVRYCSQSCDQHCDMKTGKCYCNSTYKLSADGATCADIDECAVSNGGCDELCTNTLGGYHCGCVDSSARIAADGKTCVAMTCNALEDIENGESHCFLADGGVFMKDGDFCNFTCTFGADLIGSAVVRCTATGYDVAVPTCKRNSLFKTCDWPVRVDCDHECSTVLEWGGGGSYPRCHCKQGYRLDKDGASCVSESDPCRLNENQGKCETVCQYNKNTLEIDCKLVLKKP